MTESGQLEATNARAGPPLVGLRLVPLVLRSKPHAFFGRVAGRLLQPYGDLLHCFDRSSRECKDLNLLPWP